MYQKKALKMAKRFTDNNIWKKGWFMKLPSHIKLLWQYIKDDCDAAGIWEPNFELASLIIGKEVTEKDLENFGDRIDKLKNDKFWLTGFVEFQYGTLSLQSRVHASVIALLTKNKLIEGEHFIVKERSGSVRAVRLRLTQSFKDQIIFDDEFTCQYCGSQPGKENLFVDHIIAVAKGGENEYNNLTTSCKSCNSKKHEKDVFEFIQKEGIKPLDSLSKKLDTLSKILDRVKEKDKDKEKEKEKEEEKEKVGDEIFEEKAIAPQMSKLFKDRFPNYPPDKNKDFTACLSMAYKIGEAAGINRNDVVGVRKDEVLNHWQQIIDFVASDKWFSQRALFDLNNEWQRLIQTINNGTKLNNNSGKGATVTGEQLNNSHAKFFNF